MPRLGLKWYNLPNPIPEKLKKRKTGMCLLNAVGFESVCVTTGIVYYDKNKLSRLDKPNSRQMYLDLQINIK